ncbi:MAG TPA: hypothetical protein VK166_13075 [Chitinophagaceae bacterium]|nr:hypothetical protein [Chitinophagaceae bacterium]
MIKNLLLPLLMFILLSPSSFSQVIDDPATMNMSRIEMGNFYLTKAKKQKRNAWILVGASVASMFAAIAVMENNPDHEEAGLGLLLVSTGTMVASWPTFARGARSNGMAEMLLTEPGQNPDKNYINALATKYQKQAKTNSIIAWSMLAGGIVTLFATAWYEEGSSVAPWIGTAAIYGSIPVFASAAKNKGRVSVLVRNQSIPVSHMSGSPIYRSIGVAIPISN